jgi:hypothetical protein
MPIRNPDSHYRKNKFDGSVQTVSERHSRRSSNEELLTPESSHQLDENDVSELLVLENRRQLRSLLSVLQLALIELERVDVQGVGITWLASS